VPSIISRRFGNEVVQLFSRFVTAREGLHWRRGVHDGKLEQMAFSRKQQ
jgi:hypothetical protein